jgi:hypothetical protein
MNDDTRPEANSFPSATSQTTGKTYRLINRPMLFWEAVSYARFYGWVLAEIHDGDTNIALRELLKDHGVQEAWIGFTDQGSEGVFYWLSGAPVKFRNWATGEPNNRHRGRGSEDFAVLAASGLWNDLWADTRPFLVMDK